MRIYVQLDPSGKLQKEIQRRLNVILCPCHFSVVLSHPVPASPRCSLDQQRGSDGDTQFAIPEPPLLFGRGGLSCAGVAGSGGVAAFWFCVSQFCIRSDIEGDTLPLVGGVVGLGGPKGVEWIWEIPVVPLQFAVFLHGVQQIRQSRGGLIGVVCSVQVIWGWSLSLSLVVVAGEGCWEFPT